MDQRAHLQQKPTKTEHHSLGLGLRAYRAASQRKLRTVGAHSWSGDCPLHNRITFCYVAASHWSLRAVLGELAPRLGREAPMAPLYKYEGRWEK